MLRFALAFMLATAGLSVASPLSKETVDERIKRMEAAGEITIVTKEKTTDACDKSCDVTFTTTTDSDVVVKAGETKYFKIDKTDDYTKDGGFRWKCCNSSEKSRIKGSTYIKIVRKSDTGAFDSYWVELELKDK